MNDWFANGGSASSTCSCSPSGRNKVPCPDHDLRAKRANQAPDWMVAGLLKAAAFAEDEPGQPMFNTGVTYEQVKDQVKSLLLRSGVNLTTKEIGSGTYWLTQRIANNISGTDTKETLMTKLNEFVAQYIVDKSVQRTTGVSERGPIYTREWYDKNFNPTDKDASAGGEGRTAGDDAEPEAEAAEPIEMVYLGLDGDDMGHLVEESLLTDDPEIAARISNSIHDAHRAIRKIVANIGGRLIFDGGDNMLFYMPNDPEAFDAIRDTHKQITKHSVTIGVGHRPVEAHYSLVVGKNTGKDKTVIYNEKVKAQHETIRQEQAKIEETNKKLKYRASAEELNVAERLRNALSTQGADSSNNAVKEMFWRLVQQFHLDDIHAIDTFFASVDDKALAAAAKQTFAKRLDWKLHYSEARELSQIEGQAMFHNLIRAAESVESIGPKFKALMDAVDSQELRDLDEGMEAARSRAETVMAQFAKIVTDGGVLRYSHYADEVPKIAAEVLSMAIPIDLEITTAMRAVGNAESAGNPSIDLSPLVSIVSRWIERVNAMAMTLDMICVVSGAKPMEMKASEPTHFPGQTNLPKGPGQKSPYKKHDWSSIEEYNKDQVDWRKTDDQAGMSLPGEFAERSVGGDAGGSPIYVP